MSRAKATEVTSPLSLFPFIGVLLSTMGALLVVLIAVSRSARDTAVRDVAAEQEAAQKALSPPQSEEDRQKLDQINQYAARLRDVRERTERRLRDEQSRLSHIEDQMRRLEDQMAGLGAAAAELEGMDQGHLDDRRQAEREMERLRQLIAESRGTIDSLKKENASKKRSYAIIPYEGPNGTQRRPLYIECRAEEVILQPEGIRLAAQDFMPPIDSGNPLASALRAAREEISKETGGVTTKQTEPYPLILVRPEGIEAYYLVRMAIASWDADFGYEFVGSDWKLDFPPASPQLAKLEHQAIEQARIRRQVLAAAAPRAYGSGGGFNGGFGGGSGSNYGQERGGRPGAIGNGGAVGLPADRATHAGARGIKAPDKTLAATDRGKQTNTASGATVSRQSRGSGDASANPSAIRSDVLGAAQDGAHVAGVGNETALATGPTASPIGGAPGDSATSGAGAAATSGPAPPAGGSWNMTGSTGPAVGSTSATPPQANGGVGPAPGSAAGLPTMAPSQVHEIQAPITSQDLAQSRGSNWAVANRGRSVPVRRSVRVIVREDRIAILPDSPEDDQTAGGREISLNGPMLEHVDEIVTAIQKHVNEWGIAGHGLYWRPVLVLHVGPDAQPRAQELARLLKDSGIELRTSTATEPSQPESGRR
jgi:hypothetical protein